MIGAADLMHAPQPAVLAPNHESDIDTPLVLLALPRPWRTRTVVGAASDRFYRRRRSALMSGLWINTFPFDRGGGQRRGLASAAAHLREGRNVLLFPQGTRGAGPDGYHIGVAELALSAGVADRPDPPRRQRPGDAEGPRTRPPGEHDRQLRAPALRARAETPAS